MLETRIIGRDKPLSHATYFTQTGLDAAAFQKDWLNPNRTILGEEQIDWLGPAITKAVV